MNSKKVLGNGLLLLTAFIWGTAFVAQRTGMESIEPITFNAARMALSAILIGGLALVMRAKRRKSQDERHKEGTIPDVISESGPEMISDSTPKARSNAISESRLENAPGAMSEARTKIGSDVIKETKAEDRNTVLGGMLCGLFLSVASIFQQMGLVYTTAGKEGFITAMYMLLVPILGFVLFKK